MIEVQSKTVKSVVDTCELVLKTGGNYLPDEQITLYAFRNKGHLLANISVKNDQYSATVMSVPIDELIKHLQNLKDTFKQG